MADRPPRFVLLVLLSLGAAALGASSARAACNVIPPALPILPSTLGNTDRPYARPGDWVTVTLDPTCHTSPGFDTTAANNAVTVVFTPPGGGARNAVVHRASCVGFDASPERTACEAQLGAGGRAFCRTMSTGGSPTDLAVPSAQTLRFRFADTDEFVGLCNGGLNDNRICVTDTQCGGGTCDRPSGENDDITFSGPATIAVTPVGQPLGCGATCAAQSGLTACIDAFSEERTCHGPPHRTFPSFTALPPPNNYQAVCTGPVPPCTGTQDDVRFTVDSAGNVLLPMDWRGVLVGRVCINGSNDGSVCAFDSQCPGGACRFRGVPIARFLRASTAVEAYEGRGAPILVPDLTVLSSHSPEGALLPPLFDPQGRPDAVTTASFFGSADAPETVLRVARHNAPHDRCAAGPNAGLPCVSNAQCAGDTCVSPVCVGGGSAGAACATDADCPGGECGPGLFDFSTRLAGDVGPVLLRLDSCIGGTNALAVCTSNVQCPGGVCGSFTVTAADPAPLDGLNQTDVLNAFVMDEAIENRQYNADSDTVDVVVKLGDRITGDYQAIGNAMADGLATVRVRDGSFTFPALAADDDVIAFLESESAEGYTDFNVDGDRFDFQLRTFRLGPTAIGGTPIVEPAPLVNGRSVVLSNGFAFYRRPEAATAKRTPELISQTPGGLPGDDESSEGVVSADGRFVAFHSFAKDLVAPNETLTDLDVFLRDRSIPQTFRITPGGGDYKVVAISESGRFVLYGGSVPPAPPQAWLYDHQTTSSELISVKIGGGPSAFPTFATQVTNDGNYVVFGGGSDIVAGDTNGVDDLFVRDRNGMFTTRVSLDTGYVESPDGATSGYLGPKNIVLYENAMGIYLFDQLTGIRQQLDVSDSGAVANGQSFTGRLSTNGRIVAFASAATNLVPGDTNDLVDSFIRDLDRGRTDRVSIATGGSPSGGTLWSLSADGRIVFFTSAAPLVPGAPALGFYVHDRLTATTELVLDRGTVSATGTPSTDGRFVPFKDQSAPAQSYIYKPTAGIDVFTDGVTDDTVLEALDLSNGMATTLCPAEQVAVAAGRAAFLRPESALGTADCPGGGLNPDGVADGDTVVQLWTGSGAVQNLGRGATAVALSDNWVAAIVSEVQDNVNYNPSTDNNIFHNIVQLQPASGAGSWTNLERTADAIALNGDVLVYTSIENSEIFGSQNPPDTDTSDSILYVYRADNGMLVNTQQAAREFVVGDGGIVAFRTLESDQNGMTLNGPTDTDATDGVLQIYEAADGDLFNTGFAVIPCPLEACDPRLPFRVLDDTVRFLTLECDQGGTEFAGCPTGGTDLNGDGDAGDLVLQLLNVKQLCSQQGSMSNACHTLAATAAGVCTSTGRACVSDADCAGGFCFVPPGGCTRDLGTSCTPTTPTTPSTCPSGQYCQPITGMPTMGTCHVIEGPCAVQTDCTAGAICNSGEQAFQRLAGPLTDAGSKGSGVFTGAGHCIEDFGTSCALPTDCPAGEFCDGGTCHRDHGVCKSTADCPPGAVCQEDLVAATINDADGDEVPDHVDNCPAIANVVQTDTDGDGVGDACEAPCAAVTGTRAKVVVKTANEVGILRSKWEIPLSGYTSAPVTVTLSDGDGTIVTEAVGALPTKGGSGRLWQYETTADGLMKVRLKNLAPRRPGVFQVKAKAKRWFTAAQADEPAASTVLTVDVGGSCFSQAATKKVD